MLLSFTVVAACLTGLGVHGNLVRGSTAKRPVDLSKLVSLEAAFGPLNTTEVKAMIAARGRRTVAAKAYLPKRAARRSEDLCNFPIDLHIIQDATGSFEDDFLVAANLSIPYLQPMLDGHPGSTVSLTMHRDKPINELGELDDFCLQNRAIRSRNLDALSAIYAQELSSGGWDWPENQFGAIIEVLQSPNNIPWMTNPEATKLVILITDSPPHFEGDGYDGLYSELAPWNGFAESRSDQICTGNYYPQPDHVAEAIRQADVKLGTIIQRAGEYDGKAFAAWDWFNGFIGQRPEYITPVDDGLPGWTTQLIALVEELRQEECGETVPPLPPIITVPPCQAPEPVDCDDCLTNLGCCDLRIPEVSIAHFDPPSKVNWDVQFRHGNDVVA